jgi:hypothetical protein
MPRLKARHSTFAAGASNFFRPAGVVALHAPPTLFSSLLESINKFVILCKPAASERGPLVLLLLKGRKDACESKIK